MTFNRISLSGPLFISFTVHAVLAAVAFFAWESSSEPKKINTPSYIETKLVKLKSETKKVTAVTKPKKVDLTKRKPAAKPKKTVPTKKKPSKADLKKAELAKLAKAKKEKEQREEELRVREELRKKEELQLQRQAEMEAAMKAEAVAQAEQEMSNEAQSYIDIISQKVEQNWNRPPSARNGMLCELVISLVPTGRVVDVSISKSSGNAAFDRSAEQAVKKAEVFPELKKMAPQTFEKYYRKLNLIFNPQDLRL